MSKLTYGIDFFANVPIRFASSSSNRSRNLKGSSQAWLNRQLKDPFVKLRNEKHYRARSAFKLAEIDDRYRFFRTGGTVLDLGAAPGSWSQVAVERTNADGRLKDEAVGAVVAVDRSLMTPLPGVKLLEQMDIFDPKTMDAIHSYLYHPLCDVIMSDMAPNASGDKQLDHLQLIKLFYCALSLCPVILQQKTGVFVGKMWMGSGVDKLTEDMATVFDVVRRHKPAASRDDSSELFLIGLGYKSRKT